MSLRGIVGYLKDRQFTVGNAKIAQGITLHVGGAKPTDLRGYVPAFGSEITY